MLTGSRTKVSATWREIAGDLHLTFFQTLTRQLEVTCKSLFYGHDCRICASGKEFDVTTRQLCRCFEMPESASDLQCFGSKVGSGFSWRTFEFH